MADLIVDLVETGNTLRAARPGGLRTILESQACPHRQPRQLSSQSHQHDRPARTPAQLIQPTDLLTRNLPCGAIIHS
ncbi:MAG: hypothetical protein IPO15_03030 [Anaerolineae bacterium]|nr:hypothetical protein [Anaerolineae bacterium]